MATGEGLRREALAEFEDVEGVQVVHGGCPRLPVEGQIRVGTNYVPEEEEGSPEYTVKGSREVRGGCSVTIVLVVLAKMMMSMAVAVASTRG